MQFLNSQIENLAKRQAKSLVRKRISCGIFQEIETPENQRAKGMYIRKMTNKKEAK